MQEADIDRKTLKQKITDFLQKVIPNSNAYAERTVAAPPPETLDPRADFKSEAPASSSVTPFLSREHESFFAYTIKRSLSTDSDEVGAASYVPAESTVRAFSARHFGAVASPYLSAFIYTALGL